MPSTENVANDDAISGGISDARIKSGKHIKLKKKVN